MLKEIDKFLKNIFHLNKLFLKTKKTIHKLMMLIMMPIFKNFSNTLKIIIIHDISQIILLLLYQLNIIFSIKFMHSSLFDCK